MNKIRMQNVCSDADLLEMMRNDAPSTFDILYQKYWHPLLNFAAQFLDDTDTCKEMVQDMFVHLHDRNRLLSIRSSVSSYLYSALRNRIINHKRNRSVYNKHINSAWGKKPIPQNNVEQFMNFVELQKEISCSLAQMPDKYREVYVLHHQDYFTIKQISLILKRPVDTVEKQLRRAVALLRHHLQVRKMCN